ncbi:FAD-dependent monooxygenase [Lentzea flaviverrucosa]|uniref:2-polyprenyl-6-methoxyphenol hydroxylase n=1 Tax=Lentzea flaviverrucosa TaxID=200379 RepID=A0A1H9VLI1_9PSEU|nr:FAD-dependent monooxygenase [Lentzea flaviverrucosa]RDI23782.1 2-polyprenyl-6-methoxyphenol hydroxylase-like FAD-dependent oxidoreductase [Lentzea flaviverrucosa]SES22378.1 2-polyprenyl-6-methoxyphenol hydroxylase [Lentzea flaviverrucosa]
MKNVLISGAGIGGPALAYWLRHHGFSVTVVERARGLRPGGQAIDVRGPALEVVERMGLGERLRSLSTGMRGMNVVDADGNELFRSTTHTLSGGDLASADVELLRDDLAQMLFDAADGVEYLFDDTITSIDGTRVTFEKAAPRDFDVVVGADGLHSHVRKLVFGPESRFISHLGMNLAVFTAPNFLGLDHWQTFQQGGVVGGGIMSARLNAECRVYMGFHGEVSFDHRDVDAQRRLLAEKFDGAGWVWPTALKHMWEAPDFHFDSMSQIRMDSWSRGTVVLLGDAGYCGSPMSGQGTSMALVGAYVLAGELAKDPSAAFQRYEELLRPYVTANQDMALRNVETGGAPGDDFAEIVNSLSLPGY